MFMGTSVVRRTSLAEKVFARAAEIEREKLSKAAKEAHDKAISEAFELSRRVIAKRKAERQLHVYGRVISHMKRIRVKDVLKASCHYFRRSQAEILGDYRLLQITFARHVGMYVAYRYCETSFPAIGAVYKRDHTTVINAVRSIQAKLDAGDAKTRDAVEAILEDVRSVSVEDQPYWGC